MKLVHAADLHLDSPLRGLDRYEGAPVERIRAATRRAFENLVALCLEEEAAALLLAGDLYDGDSRDYATLLYFAEQLSRLREGGVRVFLIRGNHDAQSRMSKSLSLPGNVTELSASAPETVVDEALGIAIHGQGFADAAVTKDLAAAYPPRVPGLFNVGLLHTALEGREGHAPYAPTTVEVLRAKGYDYWALGHVHQREVISREPWIVFPGNLQGRHARETGDKGATLIEVDGARVTKATHVPLDVVRWVHLEVDASTHDDPQGVVDAARGLLEDAVVEAQPRLVAARITVVGASAAHDALQTRAERWEHELRAAATDVGDAWIEKVRLRTRPREEQRDLAGRDDAVGALVAAIGALKADPAAIAALAPELAALVQRLPAEAKEGEDGVRLDDPEWLRGALEDAERLLLSLLFSTAEEP